MLFRDEIKHARDRLWSFRLTLGAEPWPDYAKGLWRNYTHDFTAIVEEDVNKRVDRFNLLVPALHLQTVRYDPQREIEKIMRKYEDLDAKGELPTNRSTEQPRRKSAVFQQDNSIPFREIWKNIKELFLS